MTTTTRLAALSAAAGLVLALGACATPRTSGPHPAGAPSGDRAVNVAEPAAPGVPFPGCVDRDTFRGDPAVYRDEPRYGSPMDLVDEVRSWAAREPGFAEIWLDGDHHRWVHVGFTGDADLGALQDAAAAAFPGEGVVVVGLPHTPAELGSLASRVTAALHEAGATFSATSTSASSGVVSISGLAPEPAAFAVLEQFRGEPLCVDVLPEDSLVPDGAQPVRGEGWRLLGQERDAGEAYRTRVATDEEQLAELWDESGLGGAPGAVDWEREIVVWLGAVWGSGCPVRLDDVLVTGSTLHGQIVVPGWPHGCHDDANSHAFVVAVERDLLPAAPFQVQLTAEDPPPGAREERTDVDADLRAPGSRADAAQMRAGAAAPEPPLLADGHEGPVEPGSRYVWWPREGCADVVVGPLGSTLWRLADGEPEWREDSGTEVVLFPVDDILIVSSAQMEYVFVPSAGCD